MGFVKVKWTQLTGDGDVPRGRSSHSCDVIGKNVLVFGGENAPRVPVDNALYSYSIRGNSWTKLSCEGSIPCPRVGHSSTVLDEKLYIFGGRTGIEMGEGSLNDLHVYDPKTNTWTEIVGEGPVPSARSYHAMTSTGVKLFVFGGCGSEGRMSDLSCFDTVTNTWRSLPTHPPIRGRGGAGLGVLNASIFVFGGFAGEPTNDLHCFNLETEVWSTMTPDPVFSPRSVFAHAAMGNKLVAVGGEIAPSDEGHAGAGVFNMETWIGAVVTDQEDDVIIFEWTDVTAADSKYPYPRGWFSGDVIAGANNMIIFGGVMADNSRLDDLWLMELVGPEDPEARGSADQSESATSEATPGTSSNWAVPSNGAPPE